MMSDRRYEVLAQRDGDWWSLVAKVEGREVASQSRLLSDAEPMIREAIAMALDTDEEGFEVRIVPQISA